MGKSNIKALDAALKVVDAVRRVCEDTMPSQQLAAFLFIAKNDGCSMADLAEYMDQAQSSISRAAAALSVHNTLSRNKKKGYGLVKAEEDPRERRRKLLKLTPKGRKLAEEISDIILAF